MACFWCFRLCIRTYKRPVVVERPTKKAYSNDSGANMAPKNQLWPILRIQFVSLSSPQRRELMNQVSKEPTDGRLIVIMCFITKTCRARGLTWKKQQQPNIFEGEPSSTSRSSMSRVQSKRFFKLFYRNNFWKISSWYFGHIKMNRSNYERKHGFRTFGEYCRQVSRIMTSILRLAAQCANIFVLSHAQMHHQLFGSYSREFERPFDFGVCSLLLNAQGCPRPGATNWNTSFWTW